MKFLKNTSVIILICFLLWTIVSYVDIIADNRKPGAEQSSYNMFVVAEQLFARD